MLVLKSPQKQNFSAFYVGQAWNQANAFRETVADNNVKKNLSRETR